MKKEISKNSIDLIKYWIECELNDGNKELLEIITKITECELESITEFLNKYEGHEQDRLYKEQVLKVIEELNQGFFREIK